MQAIVVTPFSKLPLSERLKSGVEFGVSLRDSFGGSGEQLALLCVSHKMQDTEVTMTVAAGSALMVMTNDLPTGEAFLLTVGAFLLTVGLLSLQFLKPLIRCTFCCNQKSSNCN